MTVAYQLIPYDLPATPTAKFPTDDLIYIHPTLDRRDPNFVLSGYSPKVSNILE
jgi:hypothetical protein